MKKTVKLNNGIEIPIIGIGTNTFGKVNRDFMGDITGDTTELKYAIGLGYRLIDTAIAYRNESVIGKAVTNSKLPRASFFITTKLPGTQEYRNKEAVENAVLESLKKLDTNYIDIYLIHHPWENLPEILNVWKILETFVDRGIIKMIGVSNFNKEQLKYLLDNARIKPVLNQIESHPGFWQDEMIEYNHKHGVVTQAWGPVKKVSDESKQILTEIGKKYHKTWAQVILNYQVSRGVIVIPKSHRLEGQQENIDIFDFSLTEEEKSIIKHL